MEGSFSEGRPKQIAHRGYPLHKRDYATTDQPWSRGDPDAAGITVFNYHPSVEDSEATLEGAQDKEAIEDDGADPIAQDPPVIP